MKMEIPILFGRFLVREGIISKEVLSEATKVQAEINKSFAVLALEGDFITLDAFKKAIAYQREKGIIFREALAQLQLADEDTLEKIDAAIKGKRVRLGEILVTKGAMKEEDLEKALTAFKEKESV